MLAYLTHEPFETCEPASVAPTLAAPLADDQEAAAQVAYEAALELDAALCWTPRGRTTHAAPQREVRT